MRYVFICLLLLTQLARGQDKKVTALPADTVVQATDLLYVIDQGTTSKKMTFLRVSNVMNDTADVLREEFADSVSQLRSEIGGGGAWSLSGNYIYQTTLSDSVGIGGNSPDYNLDVTGDARVSSEFVTPYVFLGNSKGDYSGTIWADGDDIMFQANNTTAISLLTMAQGPFTIVSLPYTYVLNNTGHNLNIGGSTATSYKLRVTGETYLSSSLYLGATGGSYWKTTSQEGGGIGQLIFTYGTSANSLFYLKTNGTDKSILNVPYFNSYETQNPTGAASALEGTWYYNATHKKLLLCNGTSWDTLGANPSHLLDTLYLDYADNGLTQWVYLSPTGGLGADSLAAAGAALTNPLPDFSIWFHDRKDGELLWPYSVGGKVEWSYGLGSRPKMVLNKLQGGIEIAYRYIDQLKAENAELKRQIGLEQEQRQCLENRVKIIERVIASDL